MNTDQIRTLARLDAEIVVASARVDDLKKERERVHEKVLGSFEADGVQNVRIDDRTWYLRRDVWARPKTGQSDRMVALLKADDETAALVSDSVNASKLSAYVREQIAKHDDDQILSSMTARQRAALELPASLLAVLEVDETFSIRSLKVGRATKS